MHRGPCYSQAIAHQRGNRHATKSQLRSQHVPRSKETFCQSLSYTIDIEDDLKHGDKSERTDPGRDA